MNGGVQINSFIEFETRLRVRRPLLRNNNSRETSAEEIARSHVARTLLGRGRLSVDYSLGTIRRIA